MKLVCLFRGVRHTFNSIQPTGEPATIKWVTVGGRTSAYVPELQRLVKSVKIEEANEIRSHSYPGSPTRPINNVTMQTDESDLSPLTESDSEKEKATDTSKKRRKV